VLTPLAPLEANTGYRYKITDGVQDVTGKAFVPFESTFTTGTLLSGTGIEGVAFAQETTVAQNHMFTSVTVGPDHKLYAATLNGYLFRYDIATDGSLSNEQQINTVRTMNSDQNRTIVGLTFDPASTADNLILWVTDNFMYVGNDNVPDWSSKLVRLTGADLENGENVLVNLPRSAHDHEANSIAFGPDGALYFSMGSNTGMGHQDVAWANRPEVQLSGAVLRLDTSALPGELPLDVKTADGGGSYDPYAAGAPLTLYATGVRNAYDLLWHSNGSLYAPTNGSAAGANIPTVPTTLPASCQSRIDSATNGAYSYDGPSFATIMYNPVAQTDFIHRVEQGGYYGHPNPSRCEYISYGGNPTGGTDPWQESQYPVGVQPDRNFRADDVYDAGLHASANGTIEYRGDAFGGKLAGKILVVRYSAGKDIEVVDPSGPDGRVVGITTGVTGFTGFDEPLDVVEDTAGTGVLYVTELGGQSIKLLRPAA
jgi:glucose/arabinose dehydrogenase